MATSFVVPEPDVVMFSGGEDSYAIIGQLRAGTDQTIPPQDISGEGGIELKVGEVWIPCVGWAIFRTELTTLYVDCPETVPTPDGLEWRFTEAFPLTINGQPLSPRSGIVQPQNEALMLAAKNAGHDLLTKGL